MIRLTPIPFLQNSASGCGRSKAVRIPAKCAGNTLVARSANVLVQASMGNDGHLSSSSTARRAMWHMAFCLGRVPLSYCRHIEGHHGQDDLAVFVPRLAKDVPKCRL